jgi:hypothetical protein
MVRHARRGRRQPPRQVELRGRPAPLKCDGGRQGEPGRRGLRRKPSAQLDGLRRPGAWGKRQGRDRVRGDRSYTAFAWVRASRRATTVELNLVEYVGQQRLSADTSGAGPPSPTGRARSEPRDPPGRLRAGRPRLAQTAGVAFDELQV